MTSNPRIVAFAEYRVEATSAGKGDWRVTTVDLSHGLRHEYYVHRDKLFHVQFLEPPPWTHAARFIIGTRVRRIAAAEKHAVLEAVEQLTRTK
jgi:hypothetical protein